MRSGAYTIQQALAAEATSLVKQSVCLARRRGHAQVTPLHVASTLLTSPTGLLRAACLQSHSHPLQCKALELCFNVALNRLPAVPSSVHHLHSYRHAPTISNALVATFKRAQAQQRRGQVESQQQPLLSVKIELEQLVISILDDPSVSRVMREAGFSSAQVKTNVEKTIPSDSASESENMVPALVEILEGRKKRSVVMVRDTLSSSQATVSRLIEMVNNGEVLGALRGVRFINISLSTFVSMPFDEVQEKILELQRYVRSCSLESGAVLCIGDLNWTAEYWSSTGDKWGSFYCPVECVLREISKLLLSGNVNLWLLSAATHRGYMKCRVGNPSMEILLDLHPLTVPAGSFHSIPNDESENNSFLEEDPNIQLETHSSSAVVISNSHEQVSCKIPSWLQLQLQQEEKKKGTINSQDSLPPKGQCRYWNFMGSSSNNGPHHRLERTLSFSSFPASSSFDDQQCFSLFHTKHTWPISAPTSRVCSPEHDGEQSIAINPNSTSSSDNVDVEYIPRFREFNAKNLKILCRALEREVPQHSEVIPDIASTILQCRSGMMKRRRGSLSPQRKEDTWLFFEGNDCHGKEMIAKELASVIFGSPSNFVSVDGFTFCMEQFGVTFRSNPHCVVMVKDGEQLDYESQICIKDAIETGMVRDFTGEENSCFDTIVILSCQKIDCRHGNDETMEVNSDEIRSRVCLDLNMSIEEDMNILHFANAGLLETLDGVFLLKYAC